MTPARRCYVVPRPGHRLVLGTRPAVTVVVPVPNTHTSRAVTLRDVPWAALNDDPTITAEDWARHLDRCHERAVRGATLVDHAPVRVASPTCPGWAAAGARR